MNAIKIFWGSDADFKVAIKDISNSHSLTELLNHISKKEITIQGAPVSEQESLKIKNLIIETDDYGAINEWALLGFSNNVLENEKVDVLNLWMNNPPLKIYENVLRAYPNSVTEKRTEYATVKEDMLKSLYDNFNKEIIGQDSIVVPIISSLYALKNKKRKKPVTLLFLGESGVGKTETAKAICKYLEQELVRIQFSMQQTNSAHQFIFGANHGDNSLARDLIRRESNVVLLDEFDKVPTGFYNAFYQMFDEGIFIDSNYSVNVERCLIICTTNYTTISEAEKHLGAPIYSRFSKVIKFNSISVDNKIKIAQINYDSLIGDLIAEDKELITDNTILDLFTSKIKEGYYKNMRMLKNDIEDAINYEILKARHIID